MTADATLRPDAVPETLACSLCGEPVEQGYLPARDRPDGYEPVADAAACATCGFNDVGFAGCAPELGDLADDADALLQVDATGDELAVVGVRE